MKIFISWSGERSKEFATSLRSWLPKVIQAVKPWMSNEDIESGMRWSNEISGELESSNFGIICITPENQNNPWITFEAGALSKTLIQTYVCPFLLNMNPSDLSGPLSQFQARTSNKEGTLKILKTINLALDSKSLNNEELEEIFDVWWPRLNDDINKIPEYQGEKVATRSTDDILAEIVVNTREQLRREEVRTLRSNDMNTQMDKFTDMMEKMSSYEIPKLNTSSELVNDLLKKSGLKDMQIPSIDRDDLRKMMEGLNDIRTLNDDYNHKLLNPEKKENNGTEE